MQWWSGSERGPHSSPAGPRTTATAAAGCAHTLKQTDFLINIQSQRKKITRPTPCEDLQKQKKIKKKEEDLIFQSLIPKSSGTLISNL